MAIVDKSGSRVKRMFGQIAPKYDRMNHLLSMNVDRYWRWRTVRRVPPQGTAPILDVCTGTGDLALAYCRRTRGQVEEDHQVDQGEQGGRVPAQGGSGRRVHHGSG